MAYDAVLAKLRQRSAAFAPVERDGAADLAAFLERTLKHFYVNELNPRIAEYNKLRPPPSSEWLPRASAPPSDVDNWWPAAATFRRRVDGVIDIQ